MNKLFQVKGPACKILQELPKEITIEEGQPVVYEVKLDRKPDPETSGWKKDGVPIERWDPKYKMEEKDGGKFQLGLLRFLLISILFNVLEYRKDIFRP